MNQNNGLQPGFNHRKMFSGLRNGFLFIDYLEEKKNKQGLTKIDEYNARGRRDNNSRKTKTIHQDNKSYYK